MKIVLKPKEQTVFGDIFPGTVFILVGGLGGYFLKIIETCDYNAVYLEDGRLCWQTDGEEVEPIYGTFILKEELNE